ncbi:MAG: hypothetical protein WBA76_20235, partial [Phormidesmis sp.]
YEPDLSIPPEPIPTGRNNTRGDRNSGGSRKRSDGRFSGGKAAPTRGRSSTPRPSKSNKPVLKSRRSP